MSPSGFDPPGVPERRLAGGDDEWPGGKSEEKWSGVDAIRVMVK